MKNAAFLILVAVFAMMCLAPGTCKETTRIIGNPVKTVTPYATIQGRLTDVSTGLAIKGAKVTVVFDGSVHTFTTGSDGAYSFKNVPVSGTGTQTFSIVVSNQGVSAPADGDNFPANVYAEVDIDSDDVVGFYGNTTIIGGYVAQCDIEYGQLIGAVVGSVRAADSFDLIPVTVNVTIQLADSNWNKADLSGGGGGDATVSFQPMNTTCDANGDFSFTGLPEGARFFLTFRAVGFETHEGGFYAAPGLALEIPRDFTWTLPANNSPGSYFAVDSTDYYVLLDTQNPDYDNTHPICINFFVTAPGDILDRSRAVASTIASISFTFNEVMDITADAILRVDGLAANPGVTYDMDFDWDDGAPSVITSSWDATGKVLTITNLNLYQGFAYTVDLTNLKDAIGNDYTGTFNGMFNGMNKSLEDDSLADGDALGRFPMACLRFFTAATNSVSQVLNVTQPVNSTEFDTCNVELDWDQSSNARAYIIETRYLGGPWVYVDETTFKMVPDTTWTYPDVNFLSPSWGGPLYAELHDLGTSYQGNNPMTGDPNFDYSDSMNTVGNIVLEFRIIPVDLAGIAQYTAASAAIAPVDVTP